MEDKEPPSPSHHPSFKWLGNPPQKTDRFRKKLAREADELLEQMLRERDALAQRLDNYQYFRDPAVYVVLLETGPNGSCEFAMDHTPDCDAILCFLSPVDAAMEAILRIKPGSHYSVRPASSIPPRYFLTQDYSKLVLILHLTWVASDGRMLLQNNGVPCRLFSTLSKDASQGMPAHFEVGPASLDEADYLYERAGLFAWEEINRVSRYRDWAAAKGAMTAHATPVPDDSDGMQIDLALFDPEQCQWHFLPHGSAPARHVE